MDDESGRAWPSPGRKEGDQGQSESDQAKYERLMKEARGQKDKQAKFERSLREAGGDKRDQDRLFAGRDEPEEHVASTWERDVEDMDQEDWECYLTEGLTDSLENDSRPHAGPLSPEKHRQDSQEE